MGAESIVYGVIVGSRWMISEPKHLQDLNIAALEYLPSMDDWPFLTREMFATASYYRSQVIHFGASFKSVEEAWTEWLEKFEALLSKLYWQQVQLHLLTEQVGEHHYCYEAVFPSDYYQQVPALPSQEWWFTGGPRHFDEAGQWVAVEAQRWHYLAGTWYLDTV